jgi:hypothetical protein
MTDWQPMYGQSKRGFASDLFGIGLLAVTWIALCAAPVWVPMLIAVVVGWLL